jgi:hypothetical protein
MTAAGWDDLVYLCWVITFGSVVATGFTLRRVLEHRRRRGAGGLGWTWTRPFGTLLRPLAPLLDQIMAALHRW